MALGVRDVVFNIIGRDNASAAFRKASASAADAATVMDRSVQRIHAAGAKMQAVGQKYSKAITLPIIAAGAASVYEAAKFQKHMTLIQTITDQTNKQIEASGKGVMDIATSTGTSLDQLTAGLYTVEKGGYRGADALKILKASAQGAKAENVDLATATQALTSVMLGYGYKASDAVAVQNMLIKGSGLAKTTMQDFAGSLANVVPLASSLGISFPQVAGAIATMTQHGETAQRATENLSNLITNLAGQNNVASASLQQLGVNTVDLSKNLGKRGLTGSLDTVLAAIDKYKGKDGLVVTSSFRQSALATASLNKMLDTFHGKLLTTSQGLLKGSTGIKDYRTYAMSLGGQLGASALQFLSLYKSSEGFSQTLKSGNGNVRTLATTLQKSLGGVTGMRTALMLTGTSAATFKRNVDAVAKAAQNAGVDVLGWAKTSETFQTKVDKTKASLQVLGVEIGNMLIPAVLNIVKGIQKAVQWFDNLSGTNRKLVVWGAVAVAAIFPVLAIIGRVTRAFSLIFAGATGVSRLISGMARVELAASSMGTKAYIAGSKIRNAFSGTGTTASALRGGGIGLAIGTTLGMLSRHSSGAVKAISILGSTASSALLGFAVGGPIGAAVGGLGGLVSSLAANFLGVGDNAHAGGQIAIDALNQQKQTADALLQTLKSVNGAYDANTKDTLITALSAGNKKLPFQGGILGNAAQVGVNPQTVVQAAQGNSAAIDLLYSKVLNTTKMTEKEKELLLNLFAGTEKGAKAAEQAYELQRMAATGYQAALTPLNQSVKGLRAEFSKAGTSVKQQAKDFNAAKLNTGAMGAETLKTTAIITDHVKAINSSAAAQIRQGKSAHSVATAYEGQIETLRQNLTQMGFSRDLIDQIIVKYAHVPKSVLTDLRKRGVVPSDIQAILDKYDAIPAVKTTVVHVDTAQAEAMIDDLAARLNALGAGQRTRTNGNQGYKNVVGRAYAKGGSVADGWFTVGEQGYELGYKHGNTVNIYSHGDSKKMTGMSRVPGYATGTSGTKPKLNSTQVSDLSSAFAALLAAAHNINASASELDSGALQLWQAAKSAKASKAELNHIAADRKALYALGKRRDAVNAALGQAPTPTTAYDKLATAKDAYKAAQQSGGAISAFDITQAGTRTAGAQVYKDRPAPKAAPLSANTILQDLWKRVKLARRFSYLIKRMIQLGIPQSFVEQFVAAGPDSAPQAEALIKSNPKQLSALKNDLAALNKAGSSAAGSVAQKFYKGGVDSAQGIVNGLLSQQATLNHAIKTLGDSMVAQLKHTLQIKSPSKVMHMLGRFSGMGLVNGLASQRKAVEAESNHLANKITGPHHGPTNPSHRAHGGIHMHVYPSAGMDEIDLANAVGRRMQMHMAAAG